MERARYYSTEKKCYMINLRTMISENIYKKIFYKCKQNQESVNDYIRRLINEDIKKQETKTLKKLKEKHKRRWIKHNVHTVQNI